MCVSDLDHLELVGAAKEREQVLGMVGEDRQLTWLRQLAVQDRRHGLLGVGTDGRRVAIPCRVARKGGEVRPAASVDTAIAIHERRAGKFVEER